MKFSVNPVGEPPRQFEVVHREEGGHSANMGIYASVLNAPGLLDGLLILWPVRQ